jgi:hypothetical protein
MDLFAKLAYYPQHYNAYIYSTFDYGVPSLLLVLVVVFSTVAASSQDRQTGLWQCDGYSWDFGSPH